MELKKTQLWSYVAPPTLDELKIPRAYITEFRKWYESKNDVPNTAPAVMMVRHLEVVSS